jgi:cell division protein FtsZ
MEEMNELHDFMSKFSNEVETKWGLYEDDSLDDKVKFTVLATGFGIKDVPGMENIVVKRTIEEEKLIQQKEEEALQREGRRETYYGADRMGTGRRKRRPNIYLFNLEELDNDDVISVIDTTPTFSRAKAVVESLQNNTEADEVAAQDAETNSPASADNGNTIMF